MEFLTGLIIFAIAFAGGIFFGSVVAPNARRIKELEATIQENNKTHQDYKDHVSEHFSESAVMFGDITEKYRSLYEHMSSGAYKLCNRRSIPRELATSHVNILAVESPDVSPKLTDNAKSAQLNTEELVVDVSRSGLSPLDTESQIIAQQNKKRKENNTAEIIDLDTQRTEDTQEKAQAKDYAIKAKGVINHNSLNQDDVTL